MRNLSMRTLRECVETSIMLCAAGAVMIFSRQIAEGIDKALGLCITTVIPSLFAMMYISVLAVECGAAQRIGRLLSRPSRLLFGLSGEAGAAMLISVTGGYPAGAKAVCSLYEKGAISRSDAQQMSLFCFCSGPAFLIGTVGGITGRFGGVLLLIIQLIAVPLIGITARLIFGGKKAADAADFSHEYAENQPSVKVPMAQAMVTSARQTASAMLTICLFVVLFGGISALLDCLGISESVFHFLKAAGIGDRLAESVLPLALEVTEGCFSASKAGLEAVAFAVGFGGLAVHMQIFSICSKLHISVWRFELMRLLQGILSAVLTKAALLLLPQTALEVSTSTAAIASKDAAGAVTLLIMCAACLLCLPRDSRTGSNLS